MRFLDFGSELINLNTVYEIDLGQADGGGVKIVFYYHIGQNNTGYKVSKPYKTAKLAVQALLDMGIVLSARIETDEA